MSKVKVRINRQGVRELLHSEGVKKVLREHANATLNSLTVEGYEIGERNYPRRSGYAIYAKEYPAIKDNRENNSLLKALK